MRKILLVLLLLYVINYAGQNNIVPGFKVSISSNEAEGFYFLTPIKYTSKGSLSPSRLLIVDKKGDIVYYRKFPKDHYSGDLKLQAKGLISFYLDDRSYLMDSTFKIIDSVTCKKGMIYDPHEFIYLPNGHYIILSLEDTLMNLSNYKLFGKTIRRAIQVQKLNAPFCRSWILKKKIVFEWHIKDHFSFDEVDTFFISDSKNVDWTHTNAVAKDLDGNYLISIRNFNQIAKISSKDGHVIWRLGGKKKRLCFCKRLPEISRTA